MLSPAELPAVMKGQMSTRLPRGKTIVDIFADMMRYLFDSIKALFKASEPNGEVLWDSISKSIELVLTHPNDWGGPQQVQLRNAAIKAGIVPDTPTGHASVHFVTDGEASFGFCVTHTQAGKNLKVRYLSFLEFFFDALAARRASFDYRCGRWNRRYQLLHGSQP